MLLIEVTSPSTEQYDRGEKLRNYQHLPSLREVLIISHHEPRVTLVRRQDDGLWTASDLRGGESVTLVSVGRTIAVDDLYRDGLEDV